MRKILILLCDYHFGGLDEKWVDSIGTNWDYGA